MDTMDEMDLEGVCLWSEIRGAHGARIFSGKSCPDGGLRVATGQVY